MSGNSYNSCSHLYIIFDELLTHLDTKHKDKKYAELKQTIESMKLKLEEYWILVKPTALICNLLDPRFKSDLLKKNDKKEGVKLLEDLVKKYKQKNSTENNISPEISLNKKGIFFF